MANIKTSPDEWAKCREYYEAGLSLSKIVEKTGISKTQISKRSNNEGWSKGTEKEQLIADAVRVQVAKGTLTEQALSVHNEVVDESAKRIEWLNTANMLVAKTTVKKVQADGMAASYQDLNAASTTLGRTKDNVFGKSPDMVINNTNAQQTNTALSVRAENLRGLSIEELTAMESLLVKAKG